MNSQEQALWNKHKAFFSPSGIVDPAAFEAYFKKYTLLKDECPDADQQTLLGVLFKHAPEATFEAFFSQYYSQFRTSNESAQLDAWLGDIAADRSDLLKRTFKSAAPLLTFTHQVMVLRDVQRWFPGSSIKEYATPKLLKTKPSVVLKQFTPALVDMPYLLDMSVSLMNDGDAQSQALGDTIVRGCFIARYGLPPWQGNDDGLPPSQDGGEGMGLSAKYSSIAAFSMLMDHGIAMDPGTLLQQVQLRYNAQSVMFDALAYCERVLSAPTVYPTMQDNARAVLTEILTFSESNLGHKGFDALPMRALVRLYPSVDGTTQARIQSHLLESMFLNNAQDLTNILFIAANHDSPLVKPLARAVLDKTPPSERTPFLQLVLFNEENDDMPVVMALNHPPSAVRDALLEQVSACEIVALIGNTLRLVFLEENTRNSKDAKARRTHALADVLKCLTELPWSEEQRMAIQHSPQATTAMLLYMYSSASGARRWPESVHSNGVPNMDWMPLPMLKMLYPEQMPVWNRMTIELLNMPLSSQPENSDEGMQHYMNVMATMYNLLAQTFLENAPSLSETQGLIESLGIGALEYFESVPHKKEPAMQWDLPEGMFSFDGS